MHCIFIDVTDVVDVIDLFSQRLNGSPVELQTYFLELVKVDFHRSLKKP